MKDKITGIELCEGCKYSDHNEWVKTETDPCAVCVQGSEKEVENKRPKEENKAMSKESVTENPDVQRLIKQVIRGDAKSKQLQAENDRLKKEIVHLKTQMRPNELEQEMLDATKRTGL